MGSEEKRNVVVVVDETNEVLHNFDVSGWSEKRVDRRVETMWDRLDASAVSVYDTKNDNLPEGVELP